MTTDLDRLHARKVTRRRVRDRARGLERGVAAGWAWLRDAAFRAAASDGRGYFRDLPDADRVRLLRWLQVEATIRRGFDSHFARIVEAARQTLILDAPAGYDPDEEVTRERLGEDQ